MFVKEGHDGSGATEHEPEGAGSVGGHLSVG